jgi:hypothetical protein
VELILPESRLGQRAGAQTMYTYVSKCKNDKEEK